MTMIDQKFPIPLTNTMTRRMMTQAVTPKESAMNMHSPESEFLRRLEQPDVMSSAAQKRKMKMVKTMLKP